MTVFLITVSFVLGGAIGVFGLSRWWVRKFDDPEIARAMLKSIYRRAHPHWLVNEQTGQKVCPCCGWNETEGLASESRCEGDRHR
jgi:hypothetical protein